MDFRIIGSDAAIADLQGSLQQFRMFGSNPLFHIPAQFRGLRGHFFGFPVGNHPALFVA